MHPGLVFIFNQDVWNTLMRSFDFVILETAYLAWSEGVQIQKYTYVEFQADKNS